MVKDKEKMREKEERKQIDEKIVTFNFSIIQKENIKVKMKTGSDTKRKLECYGKKEVLTKKLYTNNTKKKKNKTEMMQLVK